jgi:hypothetical protein
MLSYNFLKLKNGDFFIMNKIANELLKIAKEVNMLDDKNLYKDIL